MRLVWFSLALAAATGCVRHVNRYPASVQAQTSPTARIGIEGHVASEQVSMPAGLVTGRVLHASVHLPFAMQLGYEARCGEQTFAGTFGTPYEAFYAAELARRQLAWDQAAAARAQRAQASAEAAPPPPPPARPARGRVQAGRVEAQVQIQGDFTIAANVPGPEPRPTALSADVTGAATHPFELTMGAAPGDCTFVLKGEDAKRPGVSGTFHVVTKVDTLPDRSGQAARLRGGLIASLQAQGASRRRPVAVAVTPPRAPVAVIAPPSRGRPAVAASASLRRAETARIEAARRASASLRLGLVAQLRMVGARERPPAPALLVETKPPAPAAHSAWISGEWVFDAQTWQWAWRRGFWRTPHVAPTRTTVSVQVEAVTPPPPPMAESQPPPPRAGADWVPGAWVAVHGQWQWRRGYWAAAQGELRLEVPNVQIQVGTKP